MELNEITGKVIDSAMKVHSILGPGLLEVVYEACLQHELTGRGLVVQRQAILPVYYDGTVIDGGYRLDLVVEGMVIIELKAVERLC
jgi:GxxExxY protein